MNRLYVTYTYIYAIHKVLLVSPVLFIFQDFSGWRDFTCTSQTHYNFGIICTFFHCSSSVELVIPIPSCLHSLISESRHRHGNQWSLFPLSTNDPLCPVQCRAGCRLDRENTEQGHSKSPCAVLWYHLQLSEVKPGHGIPRPSLSGEPVRPNSLQTTVT